MFAAPHNRPDRQRGPGEAGRAAGSSARFGATRFMLRRFPARGSAGGRPVTPFTATPMSGKFEIYTDKAGEYRWKLKATNGRQIASSGEGYKTKASLMTGIASVRKNAPDAREVDLDAAEDAGPVEAPKPKKAAKK